MSEINVNGSTLGNGLLNLLSAQDIQPGDVPSYQICKEIYSFHPLGLKMADSPIAMAQSQEREISVPNSPEERVKEAFVREWRAIGADRHIFNCARLSRIYGVASIALLSEGTPTDRPVKFEGLQDQKIAFNVLDPLNTAGSLVLNQDPNSLDFQKNHGITVQGQAYHRSRTVTILNEDPIYIEYTSSAFGYVGRSVYQRALYPLKSFIQSLLTDDLVTVKSGVLIAKVKQVGSIIDNIASQMVGQKRQLVKDAANGNVLSIAPEEEIQTLDMKNLDGAYGMARKNILENIAAAADMPAKLLNAETFAEGFGEGTEDAKHVAQYIARMRVWMAPLYDYFDKVVQYRAWNPDFYKTIQAEFPQYRSVGYTQAFYDWRNSFTAAWPNLLEEPDSEKVKVTDVKLKALIAMLEVMMPELDPENKATMLRWAADNVNQLKVMFQDPLVLDWDALRDYTPPQPLEREGPAPPFSARDSHRIDRAKRELSEAVDRLPSRGARRLVALNGAAGT